MSRRRETSELIDPEVLDQSIKVAWEQVSIAARLIQAQRGKPDWDVHRPIVDLFFYMGHLDYEIKVLLRQGLADPDNRAVWEKYLVLLMYEAVETLPKAVGRVHKQTKENPERAARLDLSAYSVATRKYKETIKPIRNDSEFWDTTKHVRNSIGAHHLSSEADGWFTPLTNWIAVAAHQTEVGIGLKKSLWAEHAITIDRAIQTLATDIDAAQRAAR